MKLNDIGRDIAKTNTSESELTTTSTSKVGLLALPDIPDLRHEEQLIASNPGLNAIRANRSLFDYMYSRYGFAKQLQGGDSPNSLGVLETIMYREAFGSGNFPTQQDQKMRNLTKGAHSLISNINGILNAIGIDGDSYSIIGKEDGPSLSRYNIKPRTTMIPGVIACIKDPGLRNALTKAYDPKRGYVPEDRFLSLVVGDPMKELEVVTALMKAYKPMVDQVK